MYKPLTTPVSKLSVYMYICMHGCFMAPHGTMNWSCVCSQPHSLCSTTHQLTSVKGTLLNGARTTCTYVHSTCRNVWMHPTHIHARTCMYTYMCAEDYTSNPIPTSFFHLCFLHKDVSSNLTAKFRYTFYSKKRRRDGVTCVVLCTLPSIYLVCVVFGTAIPTSFYIFGKCFSYLFACIFCCTTVPYRRLSFSKLSTNTFLRARKNTAGLQG